MLVLFVDMLTFHWKKSEKMHFFFQKWLEEMLAMTPCLVTIANDFYQTLP